ncbi:MAG TPA: site-2 protease family protein [Gemmatimonadales bacterium]|nr:site-2 protease family protein [Gemmatimonadales bacterium]
MSWSIRLARIMGTDVKVHFTFVLLLAFLYLGTRNSQGPEEALTTLVFFLALFLCILLHEFGHILMARRFGIRTPDVILLPIGGVARLERLAEEPRQEFLIALAGPAVTLLIAVALSVWLRASGEPLVWPWPGQPMDEASLWQALFYTNVGLLAFNLVPAYPMDGGRVLRAVLGTRIGMVRSTRVAARVGQGLAMAAGVYGLVQSQPWLMLIALFVFFGAAQEASMVETRAAGRGIVVDQMMITRFVTIPIYATLRQAVDLLLEGEQREFPVVDNTGRVEGLLTRDHLIRALAAHGPDTPVSLAMARDVPALPLGLGFDEALERLRASGLPALPVVTVEGHLAGLLTKDNITDLILVRRAVAPRYDGSRQP